MEEVKSSQYYLEKAKQLAEEYHEGQFDLDGEPYFLHPAAVAKMLSEQGHSKMTQAVAYMHDLLEDTKVTVKDLYDIFPDLIVDAVVAMTHLEDEEYVDYIVRLTDNEIARVVKIADLTHNMSLNRVIYSFKTREKDFKRMEKYINAYRYLTDEYIWKEEYRLTGQNHKVQRFESGSWEMLVEKIDAWINYMESQGFEIISVSSDTSVCVHQKFSSVVTAKRKEK